MPVYQLPPARNRSGLSARQKQTGYINPPGARQPGPNDWVYRDPRWKALVAQVRKEVGPVCQDKEHETGKPHNKIELDHINELSDGGQPFARSNVIQRCHSCHARKTKQRERDRFNREHLIRLQREGRG